MKRYFYTFLISVFLLPLSSISQNKVVHPTVIKTPVAFEITGPLRDNPVVSSDEFANEEFYLNDHRDRKLNPDIKPPDFNNMPVDPNVQTKAGWIESTKATLHNFAGQNSGSYPPDANGTVGANYYFQVVNTTYEIFNKSTGASVAGPSPLNSIFNSSLPGANFNNGDPIVLWDEQANRWFYAEFSIGTPPNYSENDYMLIAVSTTSDPTGTWYSWSFDVDDTPDYMKFGIWQDGYYMATNTNPGNDVYVFERSVMIAGGANPQMIGFDNPNRPSTFDGFHCILPMDNDGAWAPSGTPGQFITIVDDGQSNPADQLWIYQLNANWTTPGSSTFSRTQTLNVNPFSGNFTGNWDNIPQPGTTQKLDGLSTILMYRAQYRNFSGTQRLVCAHAIAKTSSEANLRWYELENTGSGWYIRQQSTYDPAGDNISRWNMSIAENGDHEIGIGYSVSYSSTTYPGIRYIGQSASANAAANNTLDMAETVIQNGSYSQTNYNRWGDYCNISVDPTNDHSFWFTSEYVTNSSHGTRIAEFQFSSPSSPPVADFTANDLYPANSLTTVIFTDQSTNNPTSWYWTFSPNTVTFVGGTSATSQNPQVRFSNFGAYTVSLTATNAYGSNTNTKTDYIHVGQPGLWKGGWNQNPTDWDTKQNWENGEVPLATTNVSITGAAIYWPVKFGNLTVGTDCNSLNMGSGITELTVTGDLTIQAGKTFYVDPSGTATIKVAGNWTATGTFTPGASTVEFYGNTNCTTSGPSGTMTIFSDSFESASGWTLSGEFEIGNPGGLGGSAHGNPDPNSAYSGTGVLGVDLTGLGANNGDYEPSLGIRAYQAVSPTINCSGFTNVSMNFQRYLNVEQNSYDHAYIDISNDNGSSWTNIWANGSSTITDASWSLQTINISAYADNQAQVKIRFCIGATDGSWQYSGWNIDDFQLTGNGSFPAVFNNLTIKKSNALVSTNSNVDVQQAFIIEPGAYFTNSTGNTFNVFGNALFMADPGGMASFIDNGTSNFSNPPQVQLFLADGTPGSWHFLSSPVTGAQSGLFTGTYLYWFDETQDKWVNIVPQNVTLNTMQGYSNWVPNGTPGFVTFQGPLHNGPYSISLTNSNTANSPGWNLVGNPYPSSLDWDATGWTKNNMDNTIYYYSGNNGGLSNYHYYVGSGTAPYTGVAVNDGTNEIPPLQGFFVHATSNGTLGVSNSQRIHSNQSYYKEDTDYPIIRILAEGDGLKDESVIRFLDGSTDEFDGDYDAFKLFADNYPQVYTLTPSGTELAISTLPEITEDLVVPVSFNAPAEGTYTFTFTEIANFDQQGDLYLEDLLTGDIQKVNENTIYTFDHSPLNDDNRFLLHFSNPLGVEENDGNNISIHSYNNVVYVNRPANFTGTVTIYDMLGQQITSQKAEGEGMTTIPVTNGTGYYVVKVQSDNKLVTRKVFIR